jgi:hypothetical protein
LLAHGRWFSPGTPAFSTTKTGRHDIAEILLKVALNTKNQKSNTLYSSSYKKKICNNPAAKGVHQLDVKRIICIGL